MNSSLTKVSCFLLVLVGINTGLAGLLNIDLIASTIGQSTLFVKVFDIVIGFAALVTFSQVFISPASATSR